MKALSIHAPYAAMICDGSKTEEYRSWATSYRGDLLICATAKKSDELFLPAGAFGAPEEGWYDMDWRGALVTGHALCVANVTDCLPDGDGGYAWQLSDVRPIRPVPVKGKQRIFGVDITPEYLDCTFEEAQDLYRKMGLID